MKYREERTDAGTTKKAYVEGIDKLIDKLQREAENRRGEKGKDILRNPEKHRAEFRRMLGWPLVDYTPETLPDVTMEKLSDEGDYTLYRTGVEILEGLTMWGLFLKSEGEKPLVVIQHGGVGTPELISSGIVPVK